MKTSPTALAWAALASLAQATPILERSAHAAAVSIDGVPGGVVGGGGDWADVYARAREAVAGLSLEAKFNITAAEAVPSIGLPALGFQDSVAGINTASYVTAFPEGLTVAGSFNRSAIAEQYKAIAAELLGLGSSVIGAPVLSPAGRYALGGRNFEGLGNDPYLAGQMAYAATKATSDAGAIAEGKHFIMYEQEYERIGWWPNGTATQFSLQNLSVQLEIAPELSAYSLEIDDRTMHELYLAPWADAVRAGMGSAMCAYNKVNGTNACESPSLAKLLKDEIGFQGFVNPDYGAIRSLNKSAESNMMDWYSYGASSVPGLYNNGSLSSGHLDDICTRILAAWFKSGQDVNPPAVVDNNRKHHGEISRSVATQSIVLLKNINKTLPLQLDCVNSPKTYTLFGAGAGPSQAGPTQGDDIVAMPATYQGHLATGGGSAKASFPYLITPIEAFNVLAREYGFTSQYILNNTYPDFVNLNPIGAAFPATGMDAEQSDAAIVFINYWSGEGTDRPSLMTDEANALVNQVASFSSNTVVVLNTAGQFSVEGFVDHPNVTAIVYAGLLGQDSGTAIADVLFGIANPSGKLPFSVVKNESDYGVDLCATPVGCSVSEGLLIDYRRLDALGIAPRYPYGFGLSYTSFDYSDLKLTKIRSTASHYSGVQTNPTTPGGPADLYDVLYEACATVSNSGKVNGAEVAQLYLTFPGAADSPPRQLRGFDKAQIEAGKRAEYKFPLTRRDLSVWDVVTQKWKLVEGEYTVWVGPNSRELPLKAKFRI